MNYRKEIDGLRSIALIPVLLFHAGFKLFSGGFVGVDIFFVISGYLITSIIIHDMKEDKFSFISFYERRFRRIIPALFTVLLFCIFLSWFISTPTNFKDFSKSLYRVPVFISNTFFYSTRGYFDISSELKPFVYLEN